MATLIAGIEINDRATKQETGFSDVIIVSELPPESLLFWPTEATRIVA